MRIGSLFSGAGGLDMAVEAVFGGEVVWQSEMDKAASKVLAHRFPCAPNWGDITQIDWKKVQPVDILCGGWPCQPFSLAGKRKGIHDERALWPHVAGAIRVLRPRIVVLENVSAVLTAGEFDRVAADLAACGYEFAWTCARASDVGAPHRRERVFIVAHTEGDRWNQRRAEPARLQRGLNAAIGSDADVELLPTPRSSDCFGAGLHGDGGMDLRTTISLLPTPRSHRRGDCESERKRNDPDLEAVTYHFPESALLCTPSASDGGGGKTSRSGDRIGEPLLGGQAREMATQWGKYAPAIHRWEALTRPAPPPTEPNKNGNPRLSAAFSEWLMGWPAGWVTDPDIGISRNDQLRIVGNGVVPQQAVAALTYLLKIAEVAA